MMVRVPIAVSVLISLGVVGCLVPFPIEERPLEVNYPPFSVAGTLTPTTERTREFDPRVDVDGVLLRAVLDDPNASDQLSYRWFINYNENTGAPIDNGTIPAGEGGVAEYRFRPCLLPRIAGETIHTVDLFVADRAFVQAPGPPVNQHVAAGTQTLKITWFVRLDDRLCGCQLDDEQCP